MNKILYHIPTATLCAYPRHDHEPVIGLDPEYDTFDVVQKPDILYDPATHYISSTETIDVIAKTVTRGWKIDELSLSLSIPDYKIWSNAQTFMAEFSMPEKAAIALSIDPTIAALRLELSTWFSEVFSNDPRVVTGLDKLVELDIINETRKEEIVAL